MENDTGIAFGETNGEEDRENNDDQNGDNFWLVFATAASADDYAGA